MQEIRVSSTLTVYHDGQFWVGMFERVEGGKLCACRVVFGAEPSNEEIQELIVKRYRRLRFTEPVAGGSAPKVVANPKRRAREAARKMKRPGPSTKAQQALSDQREAIAEQRKAATREKRDQEKQRRFELRQEKRKLKHRGK